MTILNVKNVLRVGFVFCGLFLNSCQELKPYHDEKDRQSHAREILKGAYENSDAADFETDPFFASYIETYLNLNSRKMKSRDTAEVLIRVAKKNKYDPIFLMAIMKTESNFNPLAIGSVGEIGLMQIRPTTAQWICEKSGARWRGANALKNPQYNIEIGALYFKYLKKSLKSKAINYIVAYNSGINKLRRTPSSEIKKNVYFAKVLKNYLKIYQELEKIKAARSV